MYILYMLCINYIVIDLQVTNIGMSIPLRWEEVAFTGRSMGDPSPWREPNQDASYPLVNIKKNYGKSQFLMGKSTMSMAIFNSKLLVYQRVQYVWIILKPSFCRFHFNPRSRFPNETWVNHFPVSLGWCAISQVWNMMGHVQESSTIDIVSHIDFDIWLKDGFSRIRRWSGNGQQNCQSPGLVWICETLRSRFLYMNMFFCFRYNYIL